MHAYFHRLQLALHFSCGHIGLALVKRVGNALFQHRQVDHRLAIGKLPANLKADGIRELGAIRRHGRGGRR